MLRFPCIQATADNISTWIICAANASHFFNIDYHHQPIRGTNIASNDTAGTTQECGMKRLVLCTAFGLLMSVASARDFGQWEATDPLIRQWYQALMQPDNPAVSCCGEADAYWADSFEVDGDKYVAIITDSRPDEPLRRKHIDIGTRIVVPNHKLKYDQSNPTGHGIIFLSRGDYVYCYVAPGGV
jgi:hypothetical protein